MRLETSAGEAYFLKWASEPGTGRFHLETDGLRALARGPLRVPDVLGHGSDGADWLLLEFVEHGNPGPDYPTRLGEGLAALHEVPPRAPGFGWDHDNMLATLPQPNGRRTEWWEFWRDLRLAPQLALAADAGLDADTRRLVEKVMDATATLSHAPDPSLLHGDLWSGNVFSDTSGAPVLVDPAVYRGDCEVDLAMSELFGGFPGAFLDAYRSVRRVDGGYERVRRSLYQLYYLLAHVNLFGSSYVARTRRAAEDALRNL